MEEKTCIHEIGISGANDLCAKVSLYAHRDSHTCLIMAEWIQNYTIISLVLWQAC